MWYALEHEVTYIDLETSIVVNASVCGCLSPPFRPHAKSVIFSTILTISPTLNRLLHLGCGDFAGYLSEIVFLLLSMCRTNGSIAPACTRSSCQTGWLPIQGPSPNKYKKNKHVWYVWFFFLFFPPHTQMAGGGMGTGILEQRLGGWRLSLARACLESHGFNCHDVTWQRRESLRLYMICHHLKCPWSTLTSTVQMFEEAFLNISFVVLLSVLQIKCGPLSSEKFARHWFTIAFIMNTFNSASLSQCCVAGKKKDSTCIYLAHTTQSAPKRPQLLWETNETRKTWLCLIHAHKGMTPLAVKLKLEPFP